MPGSPERFQGNRPVGQRLRCLSQADKGQAATASANPSECEILDRSCCACAARFASDPVREDAALLERRAAITA